MTMTQPGGCGLEVVVEHAIQLPEVELFGKLGGASHTLFHAALKSSEPLLHESHIKMGAEWHTVIWCQGPQGDKQHLCLIQQHADVMFMDARSQNDALLPAAAGQQQGQDEGGVW